MAASQTSVKNMEKKERADSKREIRSHFLKLRDQIPEDVRREKSIEITRRIGRHPWYEEAEDILCFVSFRSEVDTSFLILESLKAGKRVYCPRVTTDGNSMEFYRITSTEELKSGYRGIMEPPAITERRFQAGEHCALMILPGAAFDSECHRIGYGGGCYDRYLEETHTSFHTIAAAFSEQIASEIPSEFHDIRPELVITDKERYAG